MEIEISTLCQAATVNGGMMNILGAFDVIKSSAPETVLPTCTFAARIRYDDIEDGEHTIRIRFCDEDGHPIIPPIEQQMVLAKPADARTGTMQVVIGIHGVKLHAFGEYSIDLAIDRIRLASVPLYYQKS